MDKDIKYGVSIVVPCYNEKGAVAQTVKDLDGILNTLEKEDKIQCEMIFINDGSSDNTATILEEMTREYSRMVFIDSKLNCGYGASLKKGIRKARYDRIVITDADGTYPNERIPELVKMLDEHDMVIGARTGNNVQIPLLRRPAKWALLKYARWMSRADIKDLNSGLRAMRKEQIFRFWSMLPNAFSFTSTITLAMHIDNLSVKYVPIDYHARIGQSSIKPIRDTLRFFSLVLRTVMYFKPLQIFGILGLLMLISAVSIGVFGKLITGIVPDVITVSLFSTGSIFIGLGS